MLQSQPPLAPKPKPNQYLSAALGRGSGGGGSTSATLSPSGRHVPALASNTLVRSRSLRSRRPGGRLSFATLGSGRCAPAPAFLARCATAATAPAGTPAGAPAGVATPATAAATAGPGWCGRLDGRRGRRACHSPAREGWSPIDEPVPGAERPGPKAGVEVEVGVGVGMGAGAGQTGAFGLMGPFN